MNNPAIVTITGTAKVGETLTATISDANGVPSDIAYQWFSSGIPVGSQSTYVVTKSDSGENISVVASFVDLDGYTETPTYEVLVERILSGITPLDIVSRVVGYGDIYQPKITPLDIVSRVATYGDTYQPKITPLDIIKTSVG